MKAHRISAALISVFAPALLCSMAIAQAAQPEPKPAQPEQRPGRVFQCTNPSVETVHTFYLRNATQQTDANELYTAIRQILPPDTKSFFVPNQMAIELCAQPDVIALAQKIITDLDRRKQNYRLTYTVTEMEGTKRIGSQHYSMVVTPSQESVLKQGSRVPVFVGSNTVNYVDVGMNFTATIDTTSEGLRLRTTVEQSSAAEPKSAESPQNPVIRQATFKGTSYLVPGKALQVGAFDIADTNRHLELEVTMDPLP